MTSRVSIPLVVCLIGAVVAGIMLARPGTSPSTHTTAHASAVETAGPSALVSDDPSIRIDSFAFEQGLTVAPGAAITVTNADGAPHTLTADDGAFSTGLLDGGASGSFTAPTTPGTYTYFCEVHPSMTGSFTVSG